MVRLLCIILSLLYVTEGKNTYIATVPQRIRPGSTADIGVTSLQNGVNRVRIIVTLMDKDNKTIARTQADRNLLQNSGVVRLQIPSDIKESSDYQIRVQGILGLRFDKTAVGIKVSGKTSSIFIQTDKPLYKPGDLVQFRVFGTNSKLKILDDPIDIYIQDPKNNRVKQFLKVKPVFGVFAGSFQLSALTNFGEWQIMVEQGRQKSSKSFSVERFVLPKFEVNVVLPSFELKTDQFFKVTITAMYTFGKPVEGDVEMTIKGRMSGREKAIEKKFKINGKASIRVLMSEIKPVFGTFIEVFAKVTESVTGKQANDTGIVRITDTPEKLTFSPSMPSVFKPGLMYNIILRVSQIDNSPLKPPLGSVNITVTYNVPKPVKDSQTQPGGSGTPGNQVLPIGRIPPPPPRVQLETKTLWTKLVQIPQSGIIILNATFPLAAERGQIQASYRKSNAYKSMSRAESPSNNYIQVSIPNDQKAKPGERLPLIIKTTEKRLTGLNYKIFAKGELVAKGRFNMRRYTRRRQQLNITHEMAPKAKLLVYYSRNDGEIVADAISFSIEDIFENEVSLKFNKETVQPAEQVELVISADPRSLVNILAVDKSILLLKTGNDITVQDVLNELQQYDNGGSPIFRSWDFWFPRPVSGIDAFSIFNDAGVYVLTDAVLFQHRPPLRSHLEFDGILAMAPESDGARGGGGSVTDLATPSRTRSFFPETWLWVNQTMSSDGRATITTTAPDTITQWITSAFAVNPTTGLGVAAEMANVTTFQKFFMRFELPYSVIRGEVIILQISVFNYLTADQQVEVKLSNNKNISFVDMNGHPIMENADGWAKSVLVKKDSVSSVFFPLTTKALGKIQLHATARSVQAADAVQRDLLVEAEGIKQNYNVPLLIDLRQQTTYSNSISLNFPPNLVKDSEFIKVQVIGDLMGPTLAGLENLLQVSYGCGEQNMIGFVPNVYVSAYLKATNRLTSTLTNKIQTLLEGGYQRELTFVHDDGSFSAFGNNDKSGSTWLTAFVVKSFAQAADFTYIDINVMTRAIQWLLDRQTQSGDFAEPGVVIHKEMQGGSTSSKKSLTTFVLIALQEARKNDQVEQQILQRVNGAIKLATDFIAKDAPASIANLYELILVSYALHLINHPSKNAVLAEVEKKATTQGGEKFWSLPQTESDTIQPWKKWQPPKPSVRALDVEMTAYALLAYNQRDDTTNGLRVLKWLGRQRNPSGGFISTQDTVIALQALSGLGEKLYVPSFTMDVNVQGQPWQGKVFNVNPANALVLQIEDLPNTVKNLSISATGNGLCLMEVAVYFNVEEELREPAFRLTPTILKDSVKGFRLRVCFSWTRGGESTMGYLEISIPTGMEADLDSLDTSNAGGLFKRAEKAFRQINLYFDKIISRDMCIEVDITRISLVARHKAVPIRLSEYYEPTNEVIKLYQSNALANATIVEVCGANNCEEVKKR